MELPKEKLERLERQFDDLSPRERTVLGLRLINGVLGKSRADWRNQYFRPEFHVRNENEVPFIKYGD